MKRLQFTSPELADSAGYALDQVGIARSRVLIDVDKHTRHEAHVILIPESRHDVRAIGDGLVAFREARVATSLIGSLPEFRNFFSTPAPDSELAEELPLPAIVRLGPGEYVVPSSLARVYVNKTGDKPWYTSINIRSTGRNISFDTPTLRAARLRIRNELVKIEQCG